MLNVIALITESGCQRRATLGNGEGWNREHTDYILSLVIIFEF